ncbi:hypothetical protein GRF29_77g487692 [Pseudopithomyces chartarum]|uniref:Uncharacterized protein n=1 Tax=Pseudopithomyces chartarum TaxID=1892770 RepID=A0AAN6RFL0_9PLEO|nr:hypothetical protein GRF29_77g487692 [Pseudopithomyces chartarum]
MSYPENQKSGQSGTQSSGAGSASQSSPAMQRFLEQKPWEEPFYPRTTQSSSTTNTNGTSTGAGAGK